jgi:hypothetical protein
MAMNNKYIEYRKAMSQYKRDSKIAECFHFDTDNCSKEIVSAHSIQRNGVLNLLEAEVNGNKVVYNFLELIFDGPMGRPVGFEPIGKAKATTFSGFCGHHDNEVFRVIEDNKFNPESDEHLFKLSYRAFAKDFHAKNETLKGYQTNELYNKQENKQTQEWLVAGSELGKRDNLIVKDRLNDILKREAYDELDYLIYSIDHIAPIATAGAFNPEYSYRNKVLNKSVDPEVNYEAIFFTILPTYEEKTHIIISCLPEHELSTLFINELEALPDLVLEGAISSLAIAYLENTVISPTLWEQFPDKLRYRLLNELFLTSPGLRNMRKSFFKSEINFFNGRYRLKSSR